MSIKTSGAGATAAQNRYIKSKYDRINLLVPAGGKEQIQAAAAVQGESINGYINRLIKQDMSK